MGLLTATEYDDDDFRLAPLYRTDTSAEHEIAILVGVEPLDPDTRASWFSL